MAITLVVRSHSLKATAATIQHEVSKGLAEKLMERLSPAEGILEAAAAGILEGGIATDDSRALARVLAERVRYDDRFEVIAFRAPDGAASGAQRGLDGSVRLLFAKPPEPGGQLEIQAEILHLDGTTEPVEGAAVAAGAMANVPWYEDGAASEGPVWTKRYQRPVAGGYGRACALGVRRDGELVGVLALGFGMEFIAALPEGAEGRRDRRRHGRGRRYGPDQHRAHTRGAREARAGRRGGRGPDSRWRGEPRAGKPYQTTVEQGGIDYAVSLEQQVFRGTVRWVAAVVIPESELVGFLDRFLVYALIGIGLLFLTAVVLAGLVAARIARPLRIVAEDLVRVGNFDLRPPRPCPRPSSRRSPWSATPWTA